MGKRGFDNCVWRFLQALLVASGAWDVNQLLVAGVLTRLFGFQERASILPFFNNLAWAGFHFWVLKGFDSSRCERYLDGVALTSIAQPTYAATTKSKVTHAMAY